jgi:hypothetical protein
VPTHLIAAKLDRKNTDVKTVVISAAIAVVSITIIAAGETRTTGAPAATGAASKPAVATTTTREPSSTRPLAPSGAPHRRTSRTPAPTVPTARRGRPTPSIGHAATKPAVTAVTAVGGREPAASLTTVPSNAARVAALRTLALQACLELAAVNNSRVVAANNTWYQQQLSVLTARRMLASGRHQALQIEENQAQLEIEAQYAIDESNCYLKDA